MLTYLNTLTYVQNRESMMLTYFVHWLVLQAKWKSRMFTYLNTLTCVTCKTERAWCSHISALTCVTGKTERVWCWHISTLTCVTGKTERIWCSHIWSQWSWGCYGEWHVSCCFLVTTCSRCIWVQYSFGWGFVCVSSGLPLTHKCVSYALELKRMD